MKPFWLVWSEQGHAPTFKHWTHESAKREAERLARTHGGKFHVLAVVGTVERDDVKWQSPSDGIPNFYATLHRGEMTLGDAARQKAEALRHDGPPNRAEAVARPSYRDDNF